jgi:tRNA(fMet)-specific endonuclease VapC
VTVGAPRLYLLDTSVLVHYLRGSDVWKRVRDRYQPLAAEPRPVISIITVAEIRSLALQWEWCDQMLARMETALAFFKTLPIHDPDVIRAYAAIDAYCVEIGQPLGRNDVWIAATAAVTRATLLTTDRDFARLVPVFLNRH